MTSKEIANLKLQGFIKQRGDNDYFAVRVVSSAGNMSSDEVVKLAHIAQRFGRGYIGFTARLCVEIPWIKYEDIDSVKKEISDAGMRTGGTGPRVRPLMACKGTVCTHGLLDTQKLCMELDNKFFPMGLPAKFKIGIVGCPNNCGKAQLNDLGIMGQSMPAVDKHKCSGCELCSKVCKAGAITICDGKIDIDYDLCSNCGKCITACRTGAISLGKKGVAIFLGGKFGRKHRLGNRLNGIFAVEDVPQITLKVLEIFNKNANKGERFADMIERIGFDQIEQALFDENNQ